MEQLIKQAKKLGNASGVLLPKEWDKAILKIELIHEPLNDIELLSFLQKEISLKEIVGVYLVGSYAREDSTKDSDIDILIISNDINKDIKKERYGITIVSKKVMDEQKGYPLYYAMLKEAKPILNETLLDEYKKNLNLSVEGVKEYLQATKKSIKKSEKAIKENESENSKRTGDGVAYSLILRLRGLYILDCIIKNKSSSKKNLLALIRSLIGSLDIYDRYAAMKNDERLLQNSIEISDAKKIIKYLKEGVARWEEIVKDKEKF